MIAGAGQRALANENRGNLRELVAPRALRGLRPTKKAASWRLLRVPGPRLV